MLDHPLPLPRQSWRDKTRIIGAVAAKDLAESVRNKTALSFVLTAAFLLIMYRLLPYASSSSQPTVRLVDPTGNAALVAALEQSDALDVQPYDSTEVMIDRLRHSDFPELGLVLEPGAAEQTPANAPLPLTAYIMYWVSDDDAADLVAQVAAVASEQLGRPVDIQLAEQRVYAAMGGSGPTFLFGLSVAIVVLFIGIGLVPALMMEEKKEGTLDVLLTSPATATTVTLGKALAGLVLCLAAGIFVIMLYRQTIVQWPVVLLAILGWSLFSVALGLLIGGMITLRQQHQVVMMTILPLLAIPVFLILMAGLVPDWLEPLLGFFPSVATAELMILAGTPGLALDITLPRLAFIWLSAVGLLAVVAYLVRRRSA